MGHIDFETVHRRKDGTTYGCALRLQLIAGDEPLLYASVLDISDRIVAENELRETSQRLRASDRRGTCGLPSCAVARTCRRNSCANVKLLCLQQRLEDRAS